MAEMQAAASYVEVLPSLRGFFGRVKKQVTGRSVEVGVTPQVSAADLAKAKEQVQQAADEVAKARTREADTAGAVRAAEAKLDELRGSATARASQVVAAEERVAKARRASEAAAASARNAEGRERSATRRVERIQVELASPDTTQATGELVGWWGRMKAAIGEINSYVQIDTAAATAKILMLSRLSVGTFGAAAAIQGLLSLAAAAAPAAGALGLLPAVGFAGAIAMGALKVGMSGFGAALKAIGDPKKFAEAVAKLSPAAREAATAVAGLKPRWDALKNSVQDKLFAGVAGEVKSLAGSYLPLLTGWFGRIATAANRAGRDVMAMLQTQGAIASMGMVAGGAGVAFENIFAAGRPLLEILIEIAAAGSELMPNLTGGLAEMVWGWRETVGQMAASGRLTQVISQGLSTVGQIARLVGNVFSIVFSLIQSSAGAGTNLLSVLVGATGTLAAFLNGAQGMALLDKFFGSIATALQLASPLFFAIGSALAGTILPAISAGLPVIGTALGALTPAVAPLARLFAALVPLVTQVAVVFAQWLAGAIVAVTPLLTGLVTSLSRYPGLVAALVAGFLGLGWILGPVTALVTNLSGLAPALGVVRTALAEAGGAGKVLGNVFRFLTGPIGLAIGLFVLLMSTNAAFRDAVFGLLAAVGNLVGTLVSAALPVFAAVLAAVIPLANTLATMLVPIINVLAGIINFLAPVLGSLVPVVLGVVGAIRAWTIVQALLNALMEMNPVGLVVLALAALVAAVIYAWQNFAWFRDLVTTVWTAIATAAQWAWSTILLPIFSVIGTVLSAVGGFFSWLWSIAVAVWNGIAAAVAFAWNNIIYPILSVIGTVLAYLGAIIFTVLVAPFVIAWNLLSAIIGFVWTNVMAPIFGFIQLGLTVLGQYFMFLWSNYVAPAWNGIVAIIQIAWAIVSTIFGAIIAFVVGVLAATWTWLRDNIVLPVWTAITTAISIAWIIISAIFNAVVSYVVQVFGPIFTWLLNTIILPVWNAISYAISSAWNFIKGIFALLMLGVQTVGDAFRFVALFIGAAWDAIREATRKPVQWVIDVVYNRGIMPVWNSIAGMFGLGRLNPIAFAGGGVVPGYGPGRDTELALLSRGEGILVPEAVRALGPGFVGWANRTFSGGRSDGGVGTPQGQRFSRGGIARFADGGVLGFVGGLFSDIASFTAKALTDPVGAVKALFSKVVGDSNANPGGPGFGPGDRKGEWVRGLQAIPGKVIDSVITKVKEWVASMLAGGGGANMGPPTFNQMAHTRQIVEAAKERGIPRAGAVIAVMTGLQESGVRILANRSVPASLGFWNEGIGGDHDSVGIFQQRQAGWGTLAQRMNARASAGLFLNKLGRGPYGDYGAAAQRVQISAFPGAYSQWRGKAEGMVSAAGFDSGGIARGTGLMAKQVISPERVLSPQQTQRFSLMAQALDRGELVQLPPGAEQLGDLRAPAAAMPRSRVRQLEETGASRPPITVNVQAAPEQDTDAIADRVVHKLDFHLLRTS